MKKLVCLALAIMMVMAMAMTASAEFKFERKIDIICPWGVGGGADSTLRPMANLLQEILGVPVNVVNVEGASLGQATADMWLLETPYSGGSEANSALVGGHCDLAITGTDEVAGLIESGDIVPILALCENRMSIYPDMQCSGELGIESYMGPWRAIFAKKGTPQEAIDAMVAAIGEARVRPEWQEFIKNAAYDQREVPSVENLPAFAEAEWKALRDYMSEQGTLTKDYPELQ